MSSYAVGACGQKLLTCPGRTAPDLDLANATMSTTDLESLVPYADGIITSSSYPMDQAFAFSATMDPGAPSQKCLGVIQGVSDCSSTSTDCKQQIGSSDASGLCRTGHLLSSMVCIMRQVPWL